MTNSWNKSARRRRKRAAGGDSCPAGAAEARRLVWFEHDLFGKPVPFFRIMLQRPRGPLFLANRGRARYQVRTRLEAVADARTAWSAAIAQSVEHVIRNDGVGGSNPSCGTS
jgi:hypothetical protein